MCRSLLFISKGCILFKIILLGVFNTISLTQKHKIDKTNRHPECAARDDLFLDSAASGNLDYIVIRQYRLRLNP